MRLPVVAVWGLFFVSGCASSEAARKGDPLGVGERRFLKAPPKPGHSLEASRQCSCRACDPAHCCEGDDVGPSDSACDDGYDFSQCGISVKSCASRCFKKVWRVAKTASCASRRPEVCCPGG